jgi:DNA-binding transcriptional regulator YiaG
MSTFADQLKAEISRLAKKEIRSEMQALKKASAQYRSDIAALKRRLAKLESQARKITKSREQTSMPALDGAEDASALRFRQAGFASLRKKLNLNAGDMAKLLGVSAQSVYHWESGKSRPRASQLQAIAEVRKMGKRMVIAKLQGV